ncbi:hypothetical protein A2U01_0083267, partial [Trifolium medium]|nr:hypothetical protein [Trifolium medium]
PSQDRLHGPKILHASLPDKKCVIRVLEQRHRHLRTYRKPLEKSQGDRPLGMRSQPFRHKKKQEGGKMIPLFEAPLDIHLFRR